MLAGLCLVAGGGCAIDADCAEPRAAGWVDLGPAPFDLTDGHTSVWSGEEIVIWGLGGDTAVGWTATPESCGTEMVWRNTPASPIDDRIGHSAVWTGEEMIVWGGQTADGLVADGAAYRPSSMSWRKIAPSPLRAREQHVAVWTGEEMLVFGGRVDLRNVYAADLAAHDPATDSWHMLQEAPIWPRVRAAYAWGEGALYVWGGIGDAGETGEYADGAVYTVASGEWRTLPVAPLGPRFAAVAAIHDGHLIVAGGLTTVGFHDVEAAVFDPEAATWEVLSLEAPPSWAVGGVADSAFILPTSSGGYQMGSWFQYRDRSPQIGNGASAVSIGDAVIVLGGDIPPGIPSRRVLRFDA